MSKWVLLFGLVFFALVVRAEVVNIDNAELAKLIASGVPIVDVRTEGEWKSTGVVAGSKLITYFDERGQSNPPAFVEKLKSIAKSDQPVILICRSGNRSGKAAQYLSDQAGYKKVYNVTRGIGGWAGEGRPVVPVKSQ